jgi:hypothetical protein
MEKGDICILVTKGIKVTVNYIYLNDVSEILYFDEKDGVYGNLNKETVSNDLLIDLPTFQTMKREEKINSII